jgi:hypothetical protein
LEAPVEIEWVALCDDIKPNKSNNPAELDESYGSGVDLIGVLRGAFAIDAAFPTEVLVQLAVIVKADLAEVQHGSTLRFSYLVTAPDGTNVCGSDVLYYLTPPRNVLPEVPRQNAYRIPIEVPLIMEGLYRFSVTLTGQPYVIECAFLSLESYRQLVEE